MHQFDNFEEPHIDLTPLIDTVFLLLIFFIMATTFSKPVLEVALAKADSASTRELPQDRLTITIDQAGEIYFDEEIVNSKNVSERLSAYPQETHIIFNIDQDAPFGGFVKVLDIAQNQERKTLSSTRNIPAGSIKMTRLCRKSNHCALAGVCILYVLAAATLLVSFSFNRVPQVAQAVEALYVTLAEAASTPVAELTPPHDVPLPTPTGQTQAPRKEAEPETMNLREKPKKKNKSTPLKKEERLQTSDKKIKTQPQPSPKQKTQNKELVADAPLDPSSDSAQLAEQKAVQKAVSALLARLEREKRYPNSARRLGLEGRVFINVSFDNSGKITSYKLSGNGAHSILEKSARQAMERVRKKWQPVTVAKATTVEVSILFELR